MRLPVFGLKAIHVEGEVARNSVSTIRANAAPKLTGNFFTTDLQKDKLVVWQDKYVQWIALAAGPLAEWASTSLATTREPRR